MRDDDVGSTVSIENNASVHAGLLMLLQIIRAIGRTARRPSYLRTYPLTLPTHPTYSPYLLTLPTHPTYSPYLLTLPTHPTYSPYLLTLPTHPTYSPYLLTLPTYPPTYLCTYIHICAATGRTPAPSVPRLPLSATHAQWSLAWS